MSPREAAALGEGISPLRTHFEAAPLTYTGRELRPHFLLTRFKLAGNAVATFRGSCDVATESLVDWEDRIAEDFIRAREMVHLIGEFFGMPLREGVWMQRLVMACARDALSEQLAASRSPARVTRTGDDLWIGERKLSVSIGTASPVSSLLHCGINIDPAGAPVAAIGLAELGVDPDAFAQAWLTRIAEEWNGVAWACAKVRPVLL